MNTKQYLNQLKNIDNRITDKIEESERWKSIATGTGCAGGGEKVQTSMRYDKMGDAVALAVDYENESKELAKQLVELKHIITKQIDSMENELFYNILKGYYIKEKSLGELAVQESYSYKQIKRYFEQAIKEFEKKYGNCYADIKSCPKMSKDVQF